MWRTPEQAADLHAMSTHHYQYERARSMQNVAHLPHPCEYVREIMARDPGSISTIDTSFHATDVTVRAEFASLPSTDRVEARKVRLQGWAKPDEQGARVDPPAAPLGASRAAGSRRSPPVVWQHMCGDAAQVPRAGRRSGAQGDRPRAANGLLAPRAPHRASSARPAPRLGQGALWDLQALLLLGRVCGLRGNGAPVPHLRAPRPARGEGRRPIAVFDE